MSWWSGFNGVKCVIMFNRHEFSKNTWFYVIGGGRGLRIFRIGLTCWIYNNFMK
jgi:hypothetical protein